MTHKFKVLIKTARADGNPVLEVEQGAASKGQVLRIKAIAGDKYQLQEEGKGQGLAPESIQVKRVGKHLHILFTGSLEADLIIEDYYEVNSEGYNGIIGQAENGNFYEYLTQDPNEEGLIGRLEDGSEAVEQALGGMEVSGTGAFMGVALTAFNPLLAGFGLVTTGALWYSGDNGVTWTDITSSVSNTAISYADSALTSTNTVQMRVQSPGSTYGATASQLVTIDSSAPTQTVVITDILDNEGAVMGTVASGGVTDDTSLNLKGTVSAGLDSGEVLQVYDGSNYLGNATVSGTNWTFADTRTLVNTQQVSYTAKVGDTATNAGPVSSPYTATISTSAPSITIDSISGDGVTDLTGGLNGTYDGSERGSNTNTVTTKPVISGTSTNLEGQTITVTINGTNHLATVAASGAWSVTLSVTDAIALNHGNTYQVIAAATSTGGKVATDMNNGMVVNTATPDIPTVLNNYSGTLTPTLTGFAQKSVPGSPVTYVALETGDTLTVTVGGATYSGAIGSLPAGITYDAITKQWSLITGGTGAAVPTSGTLTLASGNTYDVGVSVSAGGVTKTDISNAELVINTANPTITLNEISTDGYLNAAEAGQSLTITGVTNAQVGSTVTLDGLGVSPAPTATVLAGVGGNNTFSVTLTAAQVSAYAIAANAGSQDVTATVVNQFGLSGSDVENVVIDISAPTFASTGTDVATAQNENIATSVIVYDANATDTGSAVSYSLSGTDASAFNINASTGEVTLKASPNYEAKTSYSFSVVATDLAGNTTTKPVTLAVTNVDEVAPSITSAATATVAENTAATSVVYTATATDTDYNPQGALSISYSLTGTDASLLTIDSSTGQVKLNAAANYETKTSYSFNVLATDAKGNAGSKAVSLNVTNVDEVAPAITSAATATAVNENIAANTVVYTAAATDTDFNSPAMATSVTYSLKAATGDVAKFSINSSTGAVTLTESPDFELKPDYAFTVVATDAVGNFSEKAVTLAVNNLNEAVAGVSDTASIQEAGGTANATAGAVLAATTSGFSALNVLALNLALDGRIGAAKPPPQRRAPPRFPAGYAALTRPTYISIYRFQVSMLPTDSQRPDPDTLLAQVQAQERKAARGRLRIYFGASAGVGKTYAMLSAARKLAAAGQAVLVGVVETHGRSETASLLDGLELLPLKEVAYRGKVLREFDLDAALERRPPLILMDELAHSNAPGSRHPKRWQDVEELLDAGIDVLTTVNVQHLDSLNDVVGGITGIRVNETVPDTVFDAADEVVLVDIPADELLARLKSGRVYQGQQAERARTNFFRKGNLIALRELALRRTADRVEDDVRAYRVEQSIGAIWKTGASLLCCVGPRAGCEHVVRSAARLAGQLGTEWHAVYIETPALQRLPEAQRERILKTLKLAQELGAATAVLTGGDVAATALEYARSHNLSRIALGRGRPGWPWRAAHIRRMAGLAPDVDLIEIGFASRRSAPAEAAGRRHRLRHQRQHGARRLLP
eukprot:gene27708-34471_t